MVLWKNTNRKDPEDQGVKSVDTQMPTSFGKACENDDLNGSDARNILALVFTVVSVVHHYQSSKFNLLLEYIYLSGRLEPQVVATFNTFYLGDVAL